MIIIKLRRKTLTIVVAIVLVCSLGFNIYSYIENIKANNRYESMACIVEQLDKSNLIYFLASMDVQVQGHKNVEIFDISQGEVIKKVESNPEIQKDIENYLNGITGMYVKVKPFPDKGYIIRVPLEAAIKVQNQWLNAYDINSVDEVFILFPEQEAPFLLVLDEKQRPLFYDFEGNTDVLLKNLDFKQDTLPQNP